MKSFKSFMTESSDPKPIGQVMNRAQQISLVKHPDFKTFISGNPGSTLLARHGDRHSPSLHHFVVANKEDGAKYKMEVAMTPRGKYISHDIYKRNEPGGNVWSYVKGDQIKE